MIEYGPPSIANMTHQQNMAIGSMIIVRNERVTGRPKAGGTDSRDMMPAIIVALATKIASAESIYV